MMHLRLSREPHNIKDVNSILVSTELGKVLGHLQRKVAAVLPPIMDLLPEKVTSCMHDTQQ